MLFSLWTKLAVCKHKTIPLYMASDHLVHSANHTYHLLYNIYETLALCLQCLYALHVMLTLKYNYFPIQCQPLKSL